jgi:hypothetical protein
MSADAAEPAPEGASSPPITDDEAVDDALARLEELRALPVTEHHDLLAGAHEVLRTVLEAESGSEPATGGQ